MFIDSGDGEYMDIVYMYSQRWTNAFPSKGFKALTRRKKEKPDEVTESSFMRYRAARMDGDITLYEISTAYYKAPVYANLKVKRVEGEIQNPGFCDFPADYGELYFEMLTAEELTENGYDNKGRRNESLDCRVYALCAGDVYLASVVKEWQNWAINEQKMSRATAEAYYTKTWVLNDMAAKTGKKIIKK
jgi:phage terminase large subunit GpA-like protein